MQLEHMGFAATPTTRKTINTRHARKRNDHALKGMVSPVLTDTCRHHLPSSLLYFAGCYGLQIKHAVMQACRHPRTPSGSAAAHAT